MSAMSRRHFVLSLAGGPAPNLLVLLALLAAMGRNDKFDLLIKGGEVLDPSQNLRAKRDVGLRFGRVEAVEADISAERALRVMNVDGKLVVPRLIHLPPPVLP